MDNIIIIENILFTLFHITLDLYIIKVLSGSGVMIKYSFDHV